MADSSRHNNKQNQKPQTKTLNTKTIRTKSWRSKQAPAIAVFAAGFLIAGTGTVAGINSAPATEVPQYNHADSSHQIGTADSNPKTDNPNNSPDNISDYVGPSQPDASEHALGSGNSIKIEASIKSSNSSNGSSSSQPEVKINNETIELPKNGRIKETYKDDNTKTTIDVRIKNKDANNSSVQIKTNLDRR